MGKSTNNGYTVENMDEYAPKGWGDNQDAENGPYEYMLSSGSKVLLKRITMPEIFKLGFLDKLDFFTKALSDDKPADPAGQVTEDKAEFFKKLMANWGQMEETIDKILVQVVIAPVVMPNVDAPLRKKGVIYADTIPFEDKVDLFGEILNTEDLSTFREEPEAGVGHVPDEQTLQDTPVQPLGI